MKKTGVAILGCGNIFPVHANAILNTEKAQLLYVADLDAEKAEASARKYNCHVCTDYTEVLRNTDIEAVHLCLPHHLHGPIAMEMMQAGKHVLTEKPMGLNARECLEMIRVSEQTQRILGICYQNRYHSTSIRMKELLDNGSMGRVLGARAFLTWNREKPYYEKSPWRGTWEKEGGSLLMNQAIHTLDILQWLLGAVADVRGSTSTHYLSKTIETEDTAEVLLYFQSGARALFYASNAYVSDAPVTIEIQCEQGTMVLNTELTVHWKGGRTQTVKDNPPQGYKTYWGTGHQNLIRHFYECIRTGEAFPVNGREGMKAIEIIEKVYGRP